MACGYGYALTPRSSSRMAIAPSALLRGSGPDRVANCWPKSSIIWQRRRTSCGAVAIRERTGARLGWGAVGQFSISLIVADGQRQRFWRACAAYQTLGDYTHPPVQQISCTLDGGKTWLNTGGDNLSHPPLRAGSRWRSLSRHAQSLSVTQPATKLLRIMPGQSTWELLGALSPAGGDVRTAGAGPEVLWSVMRPDNYGQPLTIVFTATYP